MSQSQYTYNNFQTQSQIIQDVVYTQQPTYQATTQFQYPLPGQESVIMTMNQYPQTFNSVLSVNQNQNQNQQNQNQTTANLNKKEPDVPNTNLSKQKPSKTTKPVNKKVNNNSVPPKNNPTKNAAAKNDKKKPEEEKKLYTVSTAFPEDPLDLERNSGVPEFIKKLYRLLEDQSYKEIITWGDKGETFVVKDQTEFSRKVLPKHFKHNNFASFVRQLNKYDFHKVKVDKINSYGENVLEYKHPYFQFNKKDQLELIKRKVSNKNGKVPETKAGNTDKNIQQQVNDLIEIGLSLSNNLEQLTTTYNDFSDNYINFGKYMELQSKTLKSLVDFVIGKEINEQSNQIKHNNNFENLLNNYNAWNSNSQLVKNNFIKFQNDVYRNKEQMMATKEKINSLNDKLKESLFSVKFMDGKYSVNPADAAAIDNILKSNKEKHPQTNSIIINPTIDSSTIEANTSIKLEPSTSTTNTTTEIKTSPPTRTISMPLMNSNLKTTTSLVKSLKKPKWSQPPNVLIVDDDVNYRLISSRILKIFGCNFDVANDGQSAIEHMGGKKYDIVLMDINMPRLDGVAATNHIRRFDQFTPIISMTCDTSEKDCIIYSRSGMNDILKKPFNKNGLLNVLERYCSHLRQMSESSLDPGFSKTIMIGNNNSSNNEIDNNNKLFGLNWNNVETSKGRITELHDEDITNTTTATTTTTPSTTTTTNNNNNTSNSSSNSLQNNNNVNTATTATTPSVVTTSSINTATTNSINTSITSGINVGPTIPNVNITHPSSSSNPVLISMYNNKVNNNNSNNNTTTTTLDPNSVNPSINTLIMPNFNLNMQPQIPLPDTQNINVQYYSTLTNPTIISTHQIQSPPNHLQTNLSQIIPNATTPSIDPNVLPNTILINNLVLPTNQNHTTYLQSNPSSILGKRKAETDLRLINKSIST